MSTEQTPDTTDIFTALQNAWSAMKRSDFATAEAGFRAILETDRNQHETARHFCQMLLNLGRAPEAIEILEYTCAMEAKHADGLLLLAELYNVNGETARALQVFDRAIAMSPDTPYLHWVQSFTLLRTGDLKRGFEAYQKGYYCCSRRRRHWKDEWNGRPIPGKRLYICGESGMGDTLMMARFVNEAKRRSQATVIHEVHETLIPLFSPEGNIQFSLSKCGFANDADERVSLEPNFGFRAPWDEWINAMSLPAALGLDTTDDLSGYWRGDHRLVPARDPKDFLVGICWEGNSIMQADNLRSVSLDTFEPLLDMSGVKLVSLQLNHPIPDSFGVLKPDISSTDKLAIVAAQMDTIVTVDTFLANLGCTLGVPTHVLSRLNGDFRWGQSGKSSPWYSSAIVHRQAKANDWAPVILEARKDILRARWDKLDGSTDNN